MEKTDRLCLLAFKIESQPLRFHNEWLEVYRIFGKSQAALARTMQANAN